MHVKPWIEALRLRTLPVSIAGVLAGCATSMTYGSLIWQPALICLVFALLAQIVSNLANEYYDYKNGIDRKGREGFRRGVTEGDISASAMKAVMFTILAIDCALGCLLIHWGGYWLIWAGAAIAVAALAYSGGPWPLSHHGMGDLLVVVFYGIIPVGLTAYLQCEDWTGGTLASRLGEMWKMALAAGLGTGLLANNVLIVNNIRDMADDKAVGKHTTAVIFGIPTMRWVYTLFGMSGIALIWYAFHEAMASWCWIGYATAALWYTPLIAAVFKKEGKTLNTVLKITSMLLLAVVVWTWICVLLNHGNMSAEHNPNCQVMRLLNFIMP